MLISIIIPTYNRGHLIKETLNSILLQTYQDWECIVVDDGGEDNTEIIMAEFSSKDSRFKYFQRPKNLLKGAGSCRNYGLKLSRGELINWFDSDDIMLNNFLTNRVKIFNAFPKIDIVFCSFQTFNENGLRERVSNREFHGNILEEFVNSKIVFGPPSYLIRKEILQNTFFDLNLQRAEDADFFFKLFTTKRSIKIMHVPDVLFYVRKHKNTISENDDKEGKRLNSQFIVHKKMLTYFHNIQYEKAIVKYKERCLTDLKRLLENENYNLVFRNILNFQFFNFNKKLYLIFYAFSFALIGKGANKFKKIKP